MRCSEEWRGGPEEKSSLRGAGRTGLIARYRVQEKAPRRGGWWRRGGAVHGMLGEECACACACAWRFGFRRFNGGPRTLTRLTLLTLDVRRAMKRDLAWGRYAMKRDRGRED
jgi:hypothetical protein